MALTATSAGSAARTDSSSKSITTEVSSNPDAI
jgi:hypothetical protein